mgnify:CR=1 FL=1|jgi:hypothetical protein
MMLASGLARPGAGEVGSERGEARDEPVTVAGMPRPFETEVVPAYFCWSESVSAEEASKDEGHATCVLEPDLCSPQFANGLVHLIDVGSLRSPFLQHRGDQRPDLARVGRVRRELFEGRK